MITVDAIKKKSELDKIPLQWVGMEKVNFPVVWDHLGAKTSLAAEFDIFVNLVNPSKGIHMSRLYQILAHYVLQEPVRIKSLSGLLQQIILSQEGLSTNGKIVMSLSVPMPMETLKSEKRYLKSIPMRVTLTQNTLGEVESEIYFQLHYSSTCPQSAALAHQFTIQEMQKNQHMSTQQMLDWYKNTGFLATPHAQRSELTLTAVVSENFELNDFPDLFIQLGAILGTPTQGLVKRVDEQEFARLNANNLMFCEDAARKLSLFLKANPFLKSGQGKVSHLESLHSHNAVSYFQF